MPKMSKAAAIRRLKEARKKVFDCIVTGHVTIDQGNKAIKPLSMLINKLK